MEAAGGLQDWCRPLFEIERRGTEPDTATGGTFRQTRTKCFGIRGLSSAAMWCPECTYDVFTLFQEFAR